MNQEFEATVPDRLSPIGHGGLWTRLTPLVLLYVAANVLYRGGIHLYASVTPKTQFIRALVWRYKYRNFNETLLL